MPKITNEQLQMYFTGNGSYYPLYSDSVKLYESLKVHAYGLFPKEMIEKRRPSETEEILAYRKDTYKPVTKLPISKVISSFGKIRRSPDWAIDFPENKIARIVADESLEEYCTSNIPGFGSIEQWIFGILLKNNLLDANALIAVIPLVNVVENEYAKPVPILFNSDQVMQYDEQKKYAILKSKRKINYQDADQNMKTGNVFYYIDDQEIIVYEEGIKGFAPTFTQKNLIGQFPVWRVRSEINQQFDNMSLHQSRLDAMVAFLDEAACEYSDLKGSKIGHLFPLFWYYQDKSCSTCKGSGKTPSNDGPVDCTSCGGGGKVKFSPFAHIEVQPPALGAAAIPFSQPAGYVTRDTEILKLQESSVDKNIFKALSAINMQFLDQTPLSISGDAKNVDREELNNTVYNTAEDLIFSADKTIYFINEWRYFFIVPNEKERKAMLPKIPVPQNYDLLPEDYLMKEVSDARTAKINPLLISTLEQQLAAKKFYNQPELAGHIKMYFDLDPLPGIGVDEKMTLISNQAITKEDFVISSYMGSFIKRALHEDKEFEKKTYDQQMEVMRKYAQEKIKVNDEAQKMIDEERQKIMAEMQQGSKFQ